MSTWERPSCSHCPAFCLVHSLREDTRLLELSQGTCDAVPAIKTQAAVFPRLLMLLINLLGWDAEKSQEWGHLM